MFDNGENGVSDMAYTRTLLVPLNRGILVPYSGYLGYDTG